MLDNAGEAVLRRSTSTVSSFGEPAGHLEGATVPALGLPLREPRSSVEAEPVLVATAEGGVGGGLGGDL